MGKPQFKPALTRYTHIGTLPSLTFPSRHADYLAQRTFGSLNGLRFFCIAAVIWHHTTELAGTAGLAGRGYLGVDMFFVLSGFLIVTLLLREQDRMGTISLGGFYARRAIRIFPLYYGLIAAAALYYAARGWHREPAQQYLESLPYLLTYTLNWALVPAGAFSVAWSLAAEEQFYLVWPFIQRFASRRVALTCLFALLTASVVMLLGAAKSAHPDELPIMFDISFTPILLGVLLAFVLHSEQGWNVLNGLLGPRWVPVVLAGVLLVLINDLPEPFSGAPRLVSHAVMTLLLASLVVREDHWLAPLLTWRPLAYFGAISYGMYLFHLWAAHLSVSLLPVGANSFERFVAVLALTIIVSAVSYEVFERRLAGLRGRFRRA